MASPAAHTPTYDDQAEDKANPEQETFAWILQSVNHRADEYQRNGVAGRIINEVHRRDLIQRRISYAAQNVRAIKRPFNICHPQVMK